MRQSADAQRRLIADTAHQLRNRLAALQLRLDTLAATTSPTPEVDRAARISIAEAERLGRILDALLRLAAAEVPRTGSDDADVVCTPWLVAADRVHFWAEPAAARDLALTLEDDHPGVPEADVRAEDLAQILDILIDNACKYADPGGTVRIRVERSTDSASADVGAPATTTVAIVVEDDGPGVPEDQIGLLTRRFYRGTPCGQPARSSSAGTAGSGLGLPIAVALAEANGGAFAVSRSARGGLRATAAFQAGGVVREEGRRDGGPTV